MSCERNLKFWRKLQSKQAANCGFGHRSHSQLRYVVEGVCWVLMGMSSRSGAIHSVYFYGSDEALIQRLRGIVVSSVDVGNSVLIVATRDHREKLVAALEGEGVNVSGLELERRIILQDAQGLLGRILVNGSPSRTAFADVIGDLICTLRQSTWSPDRGVTVFGEMVALLCEQGEMANALELETLWNEMLDDDSFHLHCAYARRIFTGTSDAALFRAICESHSHVVGHTS